jgi:hypothetical protein
MSGRLTAGDLVRNCHPNRRTDRQSVLPCFRFAGLLLASSLAWLLICGSHGFADEAANASAEKADKKAASKTTAKTDNPLAVTGPKPKPAPRAERKEIDASIRRGLDFLLTHQNADGSWGSERSARPDEIYAPIPGAHQSFRAAVTSLCISALSEVGGADTKVQKAIDRAEVWLMAHISKVRRNSEDGLYNVWAHAYSIDAFCHMLRRHAKDAELSRKIRALIVGQIGMLARYECLSGGWCYYDDFEFQTQRPTGSTISFVTATVLIVLDEARKEGVEVPQKMVDRGVASILRQRKPDFSYDYGEYLKFVPMMPINRPGGSLGRTQACDLAMRAWGDKRVTDAVVETWLDRLFARELWLDMGRKRQIPHESWFQVAGYFFYYGHYYASRSIELLPHGKRGPYYDHLSQVLIRLQQPDGSWWDFPMFNYHQAYGTAFALMSLGRCRATAK